MAKANYVRKTDEEKKKEVDELMGSLNEGLSEFLTSEKYLKFLDTLSRFHDYSLNNLILILMQCPEASLVAGAGAWKKMGRYPKKGSKAIRILRPNFFKVKVHKKNLADTFIDEEGDEKDEQKEKEVTIHQFAIAYVFDVSQTDGKALDILEVNDLAGDVMSFETLMEGAKSAASVPVEFKDFDEADDSHGYYNRLEERIVIRNGMSEMQTLKTTFHEIAHSILHNEKAMKERKNCDRETKEQEAESVAYIVCRHYDIDTSAYSFPYIGGWSKTHKPEEVMESMKFISSAAKQIITAVESYLDSHSAETA